MPSPSFPAGSIVAFLGGADRNRGARYRIIVRSIAAAQGVVYRAEAESAASGQAWVAQGVVKESTSRDEVFKAALKKFADKLKPGRDRVYNQPLPGTTGAMAAGALGGMLGGDLPVHRLIWQTGRTLDTLPAELHSAAASGTASAPPLPAPPAPAPAPVAPAASSAAPAAAPAPQVAPGAAADPNAFPFPMMIIHPNTLPSEQALLDTIRDNAWIWTEKKEGHRMLAGKTPDGRVVAKSRQWRDVQVPEPIAAVLECLAPGTWLDGELIGEDDQGRPSLYVGGAAVHQRYYVFDVIVTPLLPDTAAHWYDSRLTALRTIVRGLGQQAVVRIIPTAVGAAAKQQLLRDVRARGGEGFVLRRNDSPYVNGRPATCQRWRDRAREVDVVALVYDPPRRAWAFQPGAGKQAGMVGALETGLFDAQGTLVSVGEVGSGFTDAERQDLQRRWDAARADLDALEQAAAAAGAAGVSAPDMAAFLARHRFVVRAATMGFNFQGNLIRGTASRGPGGESPIRTDKLPADCTLAGEGVARAAPALPQAA